MNNFDIAKKNYDAGFWTNSMLSVLVSKGKLSSDEYKKLTGYSYYPNVNPSSTLEDAKFAKISYSKDELSKFLENHPITWIDGNTYSVTEEKQNLLTSNIALYQLSAQTGHPRELKWNTTGDVCTVWTIEDLSALALAIGDYVQPYVTYQQTVEVQIKNCETVEEVDAVVIDYSSVSTVEPEVIV